MLEILLVALLAVHGFVLAAVLAFIVVRASRRVEHLDLAAPEKLEPPRDPSREPPPYRAAEIFSIMAEFYPSLHADYRAGRLGFAERRWVWEACGAIHEARVEIEEICS